MPLITDLVTATPSLSRSSRYTQANGWIYFVLGLSTLLWPGQLQQIFGEPAFVGHEEGLVRVIGMTLAIIGWLYVFGARSGGRQVVAATIIDRLILVPLVLVPLALSGVFPRLLGTFAVLDPLMAVGAWMLLAADDK